MGEIIQVQIGQCGTAIGSEFWKIITKEHGIDARGFSSRVSRKGTIGRPEVYFDYVSHSKRYVPRSIMVDLDSGSLDVVRSSDCGELYCPSTFIGGGGGAGNNWAKGFYTDGSELLGPTFDLIRSFSEKQDALHGFQVTHSLGGGTGSGFGSLVLQKLRDEYPGQMVVCYSVVPSSYSSNMIVGSYNALLAMPTLLEHADEVMLADNDALERICQRKRASPTLKNMNNIVGVAMSGMSCCFRFPGAQNSNLRKLGVNLIPFPRLHFLLLGISPVSSPLSRVYRDTSVSAITRQLFDPSNILCSVDPQHGRYLTAACVFRGRGVSLLELDEVFRDMQSKASSRFIEWIPNGITTAVCSAPPPDDTFPVSATLVGNSTANQYLFRRLSNNCFSMLRRRAFLHYYTQEGMDESEFVQALNATDALIAEYQVCESIGIEEGVGGWGEGETEEEAEPDEGVKGLSREEAELPARHPPPRIIAPPPQVKHGEVRSGTTTAVRDGVVSTLDTTQRGTSKEGNKDDETEVEQLLVEEDLCYDEARIVG